MGYRRYTEDDKAAALTAHAAHGGNLRRTALFCKVPLNTLRDWVRGAGVGPAVLEKATQKKGALADLFETELRAALVQAASVREGASYAQAMTVAGICADKMRLLREQTTGNERLTVRVEYTDAPVTPSARPEGGD